MGKIIFKDNLGNIHFGVNAPEGFQEGTKEDAYKVLDNLVSKKLWRCNVCNDLQISIEPPKECSTCFVKNAYIEIESSEFKKLLEIL